LPNHNQSPGSAQSQQLLSHINLPPHTNGIPNPNQMPPGARTPGPNGAHNFVSPNLSLLNLGSNPHPNAQMSLNGSPHISGLANGPMAGHTPSPAQAHMQAPPMQMQLSQHGTNSSAASVNTSPNATNKRRRVSTVKVEDDGGGGDIPNGVPTAKVKQSPRVPNKRKGGN
ncbi:hypothetical protein LTR16_001324, partial [Cryomyces antarcticus]